MNKEDYIKHFKNIYDREPTIEELQEALQKGELLREDVSVKDESASLINLDNNERLNQAEWCQAFEFLNGRKPTKEELETAAQNEEFVEQVKPSFQNFNLKKIDLKSYLNNRPVEIFKNKFINMNHLPKIIKRKTSEESGVVKIIKPKKKVALLRKIFKVFAIICLLLFAALFVEAKYREYVTRDEPTGYYYGEEKGIEFNANINPYRELSHEFELSYDDYTLSGIVKSDGPDKGELITERINDEPVGDYNGLDSQEVKKIFSFPYRVIDESLEVDLSSMLLLANQDDVDMDGLIAGTVAGGLFGTNFLDTFLIGALTSEVVNQAKANSQPQLLVRMYEITEEQRADLRKYGSQPEYSEDYEKLTFPYNKHEVSAKLVELSNRDDIMYIKVEDSAFQTMASSFLLLGDQEDNVEKYLERDMHLRESTAIKTRKGFHVTIPKVTWVEHEGEYYFVLTATNFLDSILEDGEYRLDYEFQSDSQNLWKFEVDFNVKNGKIRKP